MNQPISESRDEILIDEQSCYDVNEDEDTSSLWNNSSQSDSTVSPETTTTHL